MRERFKSLLLILLLCLLALQLTLSLSMGVQGRITFPGQIADLFAAASPLPAITQNATPRTAAIPYQIAVIHQGGVWSPWSWEEYETLYQHVTGIYAEALGSSQEVREITRRQYLDLLTQPGLWFGFEGNLPLYLHKSWTDSDPGSQTMMVQAILLTAEEDAVALIVTDGIRYFRHSTVALGADLLILTEHYPANAVFAWQREELTHLVPDQLVYLEGGTLPCYTLRPVAQDSGEAGDEILIALGFNPNLARSYISTSGDVIYVEGDQVLALRRDGTLEYRYTPQEIDALRLMGTVEEGIVYCEIVRSAAATVWQQSGGSGRLSLSRYQYDSAKDLWILGFDLLMGGTPLILAENIAYATVQDGVITTLSVTPILLEADESRYLAGYYLSALAGGQNTRLLRCYQPDGRGLLEPALCVLGE